MLGFGAFLCLMVFVVFVAVGISAMQNLRRKW